MQFRHSPHPFQSQAVYALIGDGRVIELRGSVTSNNLALSS